MGGWLRVSATQRFSSPKPPPGRLPPRASAEPTESSLSASKYHPCRGRHPPPGRPVARRPGPCDRAVPQALRHGPARIDYFGDVKASTSRGTLFTMSDSDGAC